MRRSYRTTACTTSATPPGTRTPVALTSETAYETSPFSAISLSVSYASNASQRSRRPSNTSPATATGSFHISQPRVTDRDRAQPSRSPAPNYVTIDYVTTIDPSLAADGAHRRVPSADKIGTSLSSGTHIRPKTVPNNKQTPIITSMKGLAPRTRFRSRSSGPVQCLPRLSARRSAGRADCDR